MTTPQAQVPLSPGARVAGIPELLEQILLELFNDCSLKVKDRSVGPQTVLLGQRTSQAFRDTIIDSPAIRRALFCDNAKPAADGHPSTNYLLYNRVVGYDLWENGPFSIKSIPIYDLTQPYPAYRAYKVRLHRMYPTRNRIEKRKRQSKDFRASWRQMRVFGETGSGPIIQLELKWVSESSIVEGQWENPTLGEVFDRLHGTET